ncbi:MAG TPA: HEAT repeat domain-containing protein [Thermoanaerobaculia bacterium]|nr:HEAT repeat domain-containing protein [Thermoanaerobaculia bacterium]
MLETAALILLSGGTMLWFGIQESRKRLRAWKDAAESRGLEVVEAFAGWYPRLRARAGLVYVRIEAFGNKGRDTRIIIEAPAPPEFKGVTIHPESKFEHGREIEIGDGFFDDMFFIAGPPQLVLALLDAKTRRLLVDLKEKSEMAISAGNVRAVVSGDEKLAAILSLLLGVQKRFAPPVDVLPRLARNAQEDPEPGVRLQNLLILIRGFSWSPETILALHKACSDPSPEIRLRAAKQLGAEAHGVLLELAENLEDDAVSAEALAIMDRELPFERVNAILALAMRRRRLRSARVCLDAIGRRGAASGVGLLAKVLEREDGDLASAAAKALGAIGSPDAEPSLIQALQREDTDVRVAAAEALGRVGSAAAVPPLKEAAERSRLDLDLRRAARQAIGEIQSRLQGASLGQLSLAGAEAGQLSLAQAEAGQLSLASDPAGQLSIPPEERPE